MIRLSDIRFDRKTLVRWFLFILLVKILWFSFFVAFRDKNWYAPYIVNGIMLKGGDSETYFDPLNKLVNEGQYGGMCRMPGLAPVYVPLRWVMSESSAYVTMGIFQLIVDALATLLLGILAARLFGDQRHFRWTIILASLSTFISIRANYLLSDSFCISSFIISLYFFSSYLVRQKKSSLLLAGLFITWSLFLRPVMIIAYPFLALILLYQDRKFLLAVKNGIIFLLPTLLFVGAWTARNRMVSGKTIILVAPIEECMWQISPEFNSIRTLIITMGEDFQPWSRGSAAEWFSQKKDNHLKESPFTERDFTSAYNIDSLNNLRIDYDRYLYCRTDDALQRRIGETVILRANAYTESYKREHAFQYHVSNKLRFIRMFLFPSRLDDLPLPSVSDMNFLQKGVKAASYLLLLFVSFTSLVAVVVFLFTKRWMAFLWGVLAFAFVMILGYLGFIEQRYLATSYPLMVVFTVALLLMVRDRIFLKA